jgi:hypothetical protein
MVLDDGALPWVSCRQLCDQCLFCQVEGAEGRLHYVRNGLCSGGLYDVCPLDM